MLAALSLRPPGTPAPQRVDRMRLHAGVGIEGDRHADPASPRQLLLAEQATYASLALPPHALRENLLLDSAISTVPSGTVLRIGRDVHLRLMFTCEACGRLDHYGARLAARIGTRRGVLARVLTGGIIEAGDAVTDLGVLQPAWSDDWHDRIRQVLDAVPEGAVIEYARLAHLAGIQSTYCRAFPRVLARLGPAYAARAIPARAASTLPRWDGAGLFSEPPSA